MNDFDLYLEKYCKEYNKSVEEASKEAIPEEVKKYYEEENSNEVSKL